MIKLNMIKINWQMKHSIDHELWATTWPNCEIGTDDLEHSFLKNNLYVSKLFTLLIFSSSY